MKDLKCSLKECAYNQGFSCIADKITVDDCAHCDSFRLSSKKMSDKMFEIGAENLKPDYEIDTAISCTAHDCMFNKQNRCMANGITVLGNTESNTQRADCATYTPKQD